VAKQDNSEYSQTLNLPQTEFPMRGNLPEREPQILKQWEEMDIYARVSEKNAGKPQFILHDGPPYANGDIHLGHVLNKVLKDIIVKYHTMSGFDAPYIPGWDTHGLPIEQKAIKDLGLNRDKVSRADLRERCYQYALKYVDIQREQFKRLGVRGLWQQPYLTLQPDFEAKQLGAFGAMAKKGFVYKGLKPIYWCPSCETALAEAEIEYREHKSHSIYVRFPVRQGNDILPADAAVVIWTTTPWTIPANLAITLHAGFTYALVEQSGEKLLVAKELLENFLRETGRADMPHIVLKEFTGAELECLTCKHPLYERDSMLILGEHVTLEAGTGCVHTAPGHGMDDFIVGKKYNLEVLSPVDDKGCFTEQSGPFAGLYTGKEGNKAVIKALEEAGALIHSGMIEHQYPHCWRCRTPVIYRATEQWFASVDGFRNEALAAIDTVKFIPAWGRDRIYNMIHDRGDWCISRQRAWGVPIPIFYCEECGEAILTDETLAHLQALFCEHGSQCWFTMNTEQLLPAGFACPKCSGGRFRPETDTMDVWFDSGSSHFAVLENPQRWPHQRWPADLYLEGSDQHRGWFNSSLCIAVANRGLAPYRQVLTHGFLVDEEGKKQSKSLGNTINPLDMIKELGADVMRLWVASTDYRSDIANSRGIFKQVSESYRKIRNTMRYLLGNLYDFDLERHMTPFEDMPELDRWAMIRLNRLTEQVISAYEKYEFHVVYHAIHKFCVVDMSAFYLDVAKDTLYAEPADAPARRAVQTVLYHIADTLVRLLTPVLSFTAEEIFSHLPKPPLAPASAQLLDMPHYQQRLTDEALEQKWQRIIELREMISKELEGARQAKIIGHSLDAAVDLYPDQDAYELLSNMRDQLAHILIVSQVNLHQPQEARPDAAQGEPELAVAVSPAKGEKCGRCWIFSEQADSAGLCPRCSAIITC